MFSPSTDGPGTHQAASAPRELFSLQKEHTLQGMAHDPDAARKHTDDGETLPAPRETVIVQ